MVSIWSNIFFPPFPSFNKNIGFIKIKGTQAQAWAHFLLSFWHIVIYIKFSTCIINFFLKIACLLCCSLLLTCTFLHLFLLVTYSCMFIAYLHCSCLFVAFSCFWTPSHVALTCSLPSQNVFAYLLPSCVTWHLLTKCLMYPLKHKLPPHWCFKYPSKFKLLAHHLLVIVVVSFCVVFPLSCSCRLWNEEVIHHKCHKFFLKKFLVFLFVCTLDGLEEAESQGKDFLWYPKRNWSPCLGTSKALNIFKNWSKLMKLWSLENSKVKNLKRKISQHLKASNQIEKHSLDLVMLPLTFKDEF